MLKRSQVDIDKMPPEYMRSFYEVILQTETERQKYDKPFLRTLQCCALTICYIWPWRKSLFAILFLSFSARSPCYGLYGADTCACVAKKSK